MPKKPAIVFSEQKKAIIEECELPQSEPSEMLPIFQPSCSHAEIELPHFFSDNMILQQHKPIPIWGWATQGEKVTVSFKGLSLNAIAANDRKWKVVFPAMTADKVPANMEITSGSTRKTISNILIGEVWICSGQSNMEFRIGEMLDAAEIIKAANHPLLRTCNIYPSLSAYPEDNIGCSWVEYSPATASTFSAVGTFFSLELLQKLGVPVGLINASVGCTSIEAWISEEGFRMVPTLEAHVEKIEKANKEYEDKLRDYLPRLQAWREAIRKGEKVDLQGKFPKHLLASGRDSGYYKGMETSHFNAMILPLIPYAVRGFIWYQGETNQEDGILYAQKMKALIGGWRKAWDYELPFYFVQVAPFPYSNLPNFWLGQYIAANEINKCNMICTVDVADINNCHPQQKEPVGRRLAMLALGDTYGLTRFSETSPFFQAIKIEGTKARIYFINLSDDGLASSEGKALTCFEIAGQDGNFHKAHAIIDGKTVVVSAVDVKSPAAVRFAWHQLAQPNLYDKKTLLPVFPFSSDLFYQHYLCQSQSDE